ncbi:hypothetical protein CROQUDRAFT_130573 [Cronartium quercuum f. sp. fusiforme G11]|uniref:Uncharacterized protein n=1 Tax=Cronartium quercuum f. sp. fusiforme G11 TaxID=708437 RepID=A0A9P6NQZ1_9BASI|nr:hypothetical protein CROQUDRAFT_130573 [Cronartium quercuum f. sp. fusiforme G11]
MEWMTAGETEGVEGCDSWAIDELKGKETTAIGPKQLYLRDSGSHDHNETTGKARLLGGPITWRAHEHPVGKRKLYFRRLALGQITSYSRRWQVGRRIRMPGLDPSRRWSSCLASLLIMEFLRTGALQTQSSEFVAGLLIGSAEVVKYQPAQPESSSVNCVRHLCWPMLDAL